jgi:large subunit ribosomal protein L21
MDSTINYVNLWKAFRAIGIWGPYVHFVCWFRQFIMYAIIVEDGRQYRVEKDQILDIDFRESAVENDSLVFDRVLAVNTGSGLKLGRPTVEGASVQAKVISVQKGDKIYIQKFRRRKNYDRRTGHRQLYTRVKIESITA